MPSGATGMIIRDPELLASYHTPGLCEICGKRFAEREPHHFLARGMGGGGQIDVRWNLVALGSSKDFCCPCHTKIHAAEISREQVLAVIATREGVTPQQIVAELNRLRNLRKEVVRCPVDVVHQWEFGRCVGCGVIPEKLGR